MLNLNSNTTALVVIDMQNDFAHEDGALAAPASVNAVQDVRELVERADDCGMNIVFTQDTHTENQFDGNNYYDEFERWGEHVVEGTWGHRIVNELSDPDYADLTVQKSTYDAFHNTQLDSWLSERGINNLVFCGTLANVCVLHSASSAGLMDYRPIIVKDALGYIEAEDREYSTEHADWLFGEVTSMGEISFDG